MDRLFDDFGFGRSFLPTFGGFDRGTFEWTPQTEVFVRNNQMVVRADLPGLTKDDVNVDLEENRITIRGERKSEHEENKKGIYRSERSYGSFYRTIPLPEGVDGDKAKASFNNGVLEITMPLPEKKQTGRKIEIE
jgi:HSP20 family protein